MKTFTVSFCALSLLLVAGCGTYENLQNADADLARRIIAENCEVGQYRLSKSAQPILQRTGIVSKHTEHFWLKYKKRMTVGTTSIYSITELENGWVEVDASGQGTRENFYFNRDTGEFACTPEERRAVFNDPMRRSFERTPLINPRIDRLH